MPNLVQSQIDRGDLSKCHESQANYRGTVRIDISYLQLDHSLLSQRCQYLRPENVQRLQNIFAVEGCHRLDPAHHVAALVSQEELDTLLACSNLSEATLTHTSHAEGPPKARLNAGTRLRILHGRHRLEAARRYFSPFEAWWTVDLYLDDMSQELVRSLREQYDNSANFSDGEIFYCIRQSHKQENQEEESKWWARLTKDKSKDLKRILSIKELREGFDDLLDITGLWGAFQIGTMRRYLVLKCHEVATLALQTLAPTDIRQELAYHLRHIKQVWSKIVGHDAQRLQMVDVATVKKLELWAPAASESDRNFVTRCMKNGKLFKQILDPVLREAILSNICNVERIIPSLFTFCENTKHLEPCAKAMKTLIGCPLKSTIREAFRMLFISHDDHQNQMTRQESEYRFTLVEIAKGQAFEFAYRQLWMFAMRHFPELVNIAPRKEPLREKPIVKEPKPFTWYRFAQLAVRVGFRSLKIMEMSSNEVREQILVNIRPETSNAKGSSTLSQSPTSSCHRALDSTWTSDTGEASFTSETQTLDLQHRYGRPYEDSLRQAKANLFTSFLYDIQEPRGNYITPLFVHRSTFQAFFGDESIPTGDKGSSIIQVFDCDMAEKNEHDQKANRGPDFLDNIAPEAIDARDQEGAKVVPCVADAVGSIDYILATDWISTQGADDHGNDHTLVPVDLPVNSIVNTCRGSQNSEHLIADKIDHSSAEDSGTDTPPKLPARQHTGTLSDYRGPETESQGAQSPSSQHDWTAWGSAPSQIAGNAPVTCANLMGLGSPPIDAPQLHEDETMFRSCIPLSSDDDLSTLSDGEAQPPQEDSIQFLPAEQAANEGYDNCPGECQNITDQQVLEPSSEDTARPLEPPSRDEITYTDYQVIGRSEASLRQDFIPFPQTPVTAYGSRDSDLSPTFHLHELAGASGESADNKRMSDDLFISTPSTAEQPILQGVHAEANANMTHIPEAGGSCQDEPVMMDRRIQQIRSQDALLKNFDTEARAPRSYNYSSQWRPALPQESSNENLAHHHVEVQQEALDPRFGTGIQERQDVEEGEYPEYRGSGKRGDEKRQKLSSNLRTEQSKRPRRENSPEPGEDRLPIFMRTGERGDEKRQKLSDGRY
ncbi:hypothetical protein ACLMJK_009519 [Lecanora helva]